MIVHRQNKLSPRTLSLSKAAAAFLVILLAPSFFSNRENRGVATRGLTIKPPIGSPAYAALEDLRLDHTQLSARPIEMVRASAAITLQSGETFQWLKLAEPQKKLQVSVQRYLAGVSLGGRLRDMAQLRGLKIKANLVDVPTPQAVTTVALAREADSFTQRAQKLVAQALSERGPENSRVLLSSSTGNKVLVQSTEQVQLPVEVRGEAQPLVLAAAPQPSQVPSADPGLAAMPGLAWTPSPTMPHAQREKSIQVAGNIELDGGLAYTGREGELMVFHAVDGFALDYAQLDAATGEFKFNISEPIGEVVAEIRDGFGQVIGRGAALLAALPQVAPSQLSIERLVVAPTVRDSSVEVLSGYSTDTLKMKVEGARVSVDGVGLLAMQEDGFMFIEDRLAPDSNYIVRAVAPNHWGTILVGNNSDNNRVKLFSNRMMDALLSIQAGENAERARQMGVIWGRVFANGKPLEGAEVELAGRQSASPIYFNQLLIPDRFSGATSNNGVFSFIWVSPGLQQVRVKVRGQYVPAQIIPVESGNVSYVEFHINQSIRAPLEIFDPFSPAAPVRASLNLADTEDHFIDINGRGGLELQQGSGLMTLEVDAGEKYELTRFFAERKPKGIRIPLISRDFVSRIISRRRINLDSGRGMIVGVGLSERYKVSLPNQTAVDQSAPVIVYFDASGNPVIGETGPAEGGFAIFNVPLGLQSIVVETAESQKLLSRIAVIDETFLNVFNFK